MSGTAYIEVKVAGGGSFQITGAVLGEYSGSATPDGNDFYNVRLVGYRNGLEVASTGLHDSSGVYQTAYPLDYSAFSGTTIDTVRGYYSWLGSSNAILTYTNLESMTVVAATVTEPPSYENGTPLVGSIDLSGGVLSVDLDKDGTAYYVIVADGDGVPSATQVKSGQNSAGSAALISGSFSTVGTTGSEAFSGLAPGTAYDLYAVAEDLESPANLQSAPTKVDFSTASPDSDGSLTASASVVEPVALATTADTVGEAVDVFDFTLTDGGTSDGLAMNVSQVTVNVSGTSTDTERSNITWRLNGPDASNVTGTYNAATNTITFSSLAVSVANGGNETYTVNAYYNDNTNLTEDHAIVLSVDGDTDLTVGGSGTQMGATSAVSNGSGTTVDVVASQLAFTTQPSGSVSGSALITQPVVTAQDGFGNTDIDFTETVALTEASAGSLTNNTQAAASGVATFTGLTYTATADQESFTLTANDQDGVGSNLSTADANAVTTDVVATKLIFDTQPAPATVSSGVATAFSTVPVVTAVDGNNLPDTGYSTDITLAEVNGAGTASLTATGDTDGNGATVSLTPVSGTATFTDLQAVYTASGSSNETFNLRASSGGLSTADSTELTASVTPTIRSVSVPSNGTYVAGQNLDFTVNASQPMTVNTVGGTPRLSLTVGGSVVYASYVSGSGTSALTFRYTLQAGDLDADGIGVNALETNGGTLRDGSGNDLDTTLNSVGSTSSVLVDAVNPTVSSVSVPSNDRYVAGESLDFTVNASENVTVNTAGGTPQIPLSVGSTTRYASYISGSGTSALAFRYTVQAGDEDADGVVVSAAVDPNGGTLQDGAGNDLATTLNSVGSTNDVLVDAVTPAGYSVSMDDGMLNASESVSASFTFAGAEIETDYSYTVSSSGGGTPVTGSGTIASASDQITGLDLSGLGDGALTLTLILTDAAGNSGTAATDTAMLDATVPSGHSVSFDDGTLNSTESGSASFTFASAEAGADYSYTISSSGGGTPVTGTGTIASATDQIGSIDLSSLSDGTLILAVTLTDAAGNSASAVTDTAMLDAAAPDGHGVSFDDDAFNNTEAGAASFTFNGAEVAADYSYTVSSSGGGTPVTGSGTVASDGEQISGIDLGGLSDGTLTLSVTLTDTAGNSAGAVTDTAILDTTAPAGQGVSFDETDISAAEATSVSFTFNGAEVGADFSYSISSNGGGTPVTGMGTLSDGSQQISSVDVSGLGDGTLTLSAELTDEAGNQSSPVTATATLDATAASTTLDSPAEAVTNAAFTVSITFDEPVSGFAVGDITVSNATVGSFAGSGASYTATITPTADGTVTVDVGSGVAQDAAGNPSTAATQLSRVYDGTAPAPVITTDVTADVTNAPIGLSVDFGETVTGFVSGDLSVNNGSVTGFTDSGNGLFALTVEATGEGDVTIELLAGVAEDEAGNASEASDPLVIAFDGSGPVLQSSVPAPGASDVPYESDLTLTFDEPVFAGAGELVVQDATEGVEHTRLSVTDSQISIDDAQVTIVLDKVLVPTHEYYVTFAANSLEDAAGNGWAGILSGTAFRFTVGNQAPEADNDSATLDQNTRVALDVLANDLDQEGRLNPASVRVITQPAHGHASVETSTGAVTYEPEPDYTGPDSFTYVVEDEFGGESNAATVSLSVGPAGLPPVTRGDVATVAPGGTVALAPLANDRAAALGVALNLQSVELVLSPHFGTVQWVDGELTYTAAEEFQGVESLAYTVADANGVRSAVTHLFINVADGAAAPLARDDSADTEMAAEVAVDVLANDEATGSALASGTVELASLPRHGVAEVDAATGAIAYTPDADFRGEDVFHYTVRDDRGLVSESALVTINVGLAGVPVAEDDRVQAMDGATLAINVLGNDRGLAVALNPATLSVVDNPAQGLVALDIGAGVFRYTPDDTFDGTDTFTYTVQDEDGQVSAPATVTVTDQPGNNRPLANDLALTVAEDSETSVSPMTNDQDLNGTLDTASLQVEQQPLNGTLTLGASGAFSYTPGENFYGEDRFTYTVADDTGRTSRLAVVRLVVAPVPDEPQISGSPTTTVPAGNAYRFTPVATDIDGNPLTFSVANLPDWATFDVQNGRISGTPELDDVGSYGDIVISASNGDESSELAAFSVRVTDNSGGSDDGGQGEPESPVAPGSDERADIPLIDPDNPAVEVGNHQWPSYTDDQPSKARYETTFVDAAGEKRSVSILVDDPQAPLPATESPDGSGRQTLTFSQTDGSEQTVAVSPSGETTIAVFAQAGDANPASRLTSDVAELSVTALAGGDMRSAVVIENGGGGSSEMTVVQSAKGGVLVSGTRYSADGAVLETTTVQFDMVPADIELAADGTVSLRGEVTSGSDTTAVEYRVTPAGTVSAVSQYADGISTPVSSGVTVRQGGSVGMVMADGHIALEQPYTGGGAEHQASVARDGQVQYIDGSDDTTNLPAGSILVIDGDQASTGDRDLDPDGNGLNRAGEISGSDGGQPTISRLEVTDVSNGNESVFVSPAADGDGINASRSLSEGELSARIRLDGTSVHRRSGRDGRRDNQARSLIPGSLSLFFNDRIVTVADEIDATMLTELLDNGEVRHEVATGGESTRAFSYLPGSSTVMERDGDGLARVVTRAAKNGRSLEATANADGSARHRLINRLGERSAADIRVPGAFTSLNEDGNLRSRVRLEGSDVCAWVETFGNGETGTGFGTYDPDTLACQGVERPTSLESLFEAGNSVAVESESGEHTITIETRVTRPIRF
ncbi:Ig-like domain-containing protein [Marinobacter sp. TBZ242]|uniref:Ig-like domain-containing protein n=1 Tax=Marinobacter azerbaijanicus TaxID=3050455 RepID=A0ABT7ICB7_9GAMM|nr:Ig-like domain-containing protein [Marinobacter sp. TBZ242]MDL0431355.1 Ig-like domain-containing protein [Marinobacter sp. TBZ242]